MSTKLEQLKVLQEYKAKFNGTDDNADLEEKINLALNGISLLCKMLEIKLLEEIGAKL